MTLKIKAVVILNEENSEFFNELLKKGVGAVEPEMKKQLKEIITLTGLENETTKSFFKL